MSNVQFLVLCGVLCAIASEICELNRDKAIRARGATWAFIGSTLITVAFVTWLGWLV